MNQAAATTSSPSALPRILMLPGLACDERIIEPQRGVRADIVALTYVVPKLGESLRDYAVRYARTIDASTPFYLAGISFGGMLAQELATVLAPQCRPRGLILIASCRTGAGVPPVNAALARLASRLPNRLINAAKVVMPQFRGLFGIEAGWQVDLFKAMLRDASPQLIKWSLRATAGWDGAALPADLPIFQVHAERDLILPVRGAGPVDRVIAGAGHAINVSRAAEVNAAINDWLAALGELPIDSNA